jgi:hypothetical protein
MSENPIFFLLWNFCYISHFIHVALDGKITPLNLNRLPFQNFESKHKNASISLFLGLQTKLQFKVVNMVFCNVHGVMKLCLWLLQEWNTRGY